MKKEKIKKLHVIRLNPRLKKVAAQVDLQEVGIGSAAMALTEEL